MLGGEGPRRPHLQSNRMKIKTTLLLMAEGGVFSLAGVAEKAEKSGVESTVGGLAARRSSFFSSRGAARRCAALIGGGEGGD